MTKSLSVKYITKQKLCQARTTESYGTGSSPKQKTAHPSSPSGQERRFFEVLPSPLRRVFGFAYFECLVIISIP